MTPVSNLPGFIILLQNSLQIVCKCVYISYLCDNKREKDMEQKDVYFRFTNDWRRDLEKGYSNYFATGQKLDGLCAYSASPLDTLNYSREEIIQECMERAINIARNSYAGYSSKDNVVILTGDYAGNGNDGVLIKNAEFYHEFNICDQL